MRFLEKQSIKYHFASVCFLILMAAAFNTSCQHSNSSETLLDEEDVHILNLVVGADNDFSMLEMTTPPPIISHYAPCKENLWGYEQEYIFNDSVQEHLRDGLPFKWNFLRNIILYMPDEAFYYNHPDDFYGVCLKSDDDRVKIYQICDFQDLDSQMPDLPNSFTQFLYTTESEEEMNYAFSMGVSSGRLFTYYTDAMHIITNEYNRQRNAEELLTLKDKQGRTFYIVIQNERTTSPHTNMMNTAIAFTIEEDGPRALPVFCTGKETDSKLSACYDSPQATCLMTYDQKSRILYVPIARAEENFKHNGKYILYKFDGTCFQNIGEGRKKA